MISYFSLLFLLSLFGLSFKFFWEISLRIFSESEIDKREVKFAELMSGMNG